MKKKNIFFFKSFSNIILLISYLFTLFFISFLIVIFLRPSNNEPSLEENTQIPQTKESTLFKVYENEKTLYILIHYAQKQNEKELLSLAYEYFNQYQKAIYLEVNNGDDIVYININDEGVAVIV